MGHSRYVPHSLNNHREPVTANLPQAKPNYGKQKPDKRRTRRQIGTPRSS